MYVVCNVKRQQYGVNIFHCKGFLRCGCAILTNMKKANGKVSAGDFKRIELSELRQGRRGKHHDAITPIVEEIAELG